MGAKLGKVRASGETYLTKLKAIFTKLAAYQRREAGIPEKRPGACLGVIRLDYSYPPAPGDIDHPVSFGYRVVYRVVPGLTFEMCQSGELSADVEAEVVTAIRWLDEVKNVSAITGDCGFMMWFQALARQHTRKPVLMSSLVQLPAITCAFAPGEQIAIFTANSSTLMPMEALIAKECGVDVMDKRYVIVGCQDVPGFEAVAVGGKVDTQAVQPGIVALAKRTIAQHPSIRAILLECTELPPYADALRYSTGLPVYDAITCANSFVDGFLDNPRFGLMGWMDSFDGRQEDYKLGIELTDDERLKCGYCGATLLQVPN